MKSNISSKIIVAVLAMVKVMELNKTSDSGYEITGGVEGKALKYVLQALGMEYKLVIPRDGEYGRLNRSVEWTGLIGMVVRGEADLAFSSLAMYPKRQEVVDFTKPYTMASITFAISRTERQRLKNAYLYPFRCNVWACFLFLFFTMTTAIWLVFEKKYSVGRIVFELCGNTLRQPFTFSGGSWKLRFLLAVIGLYGFVLTSGYSGVLLSFMTVAMPGKTIETLEQLSDAVAKGTHRCYAGRGTLIAKSLISTKEKHLMLLGNAIRDNKWFLYSEQISSLKVISPNDAIVTNNLIFDIFYRGTLQHKTKYLISKDTISSAAYGGAMNRKFCCKKKLNKIITRLVESGLMVKYVREAAFENWVKTKKVEKTAENERKISIEDISGALIILCAGYAISFLTLLAEILLYKYCGSGNIYCSSK